MSIGNQVKRLILLAAVVVFSGCAVNPAKQLEQTLEDYKHRKTPHKAFAVGHFPNGSWVAGWSWAQPSIETAKQQAMSHCEEQAARGCPEFCV